MSSYLQHQWEEQFVSHLIEDDKKAIYLHYGDGEKRQHLIGPEADRAFYEVLKQGCFVFYQHSDYDLIIQISSEDFIKIMNQEDVYIVDPGFTRTYVHTHEGECDHILVVCE